MNYAQTMKSAARLPVRLVCPQCRLAAADGVRATLLAQTPADCDAGAVCPECRAHYPCVEGVWCVPPDLDSFRAAQAEALAPDWPRIAADAAVHSCNPADQIRHLWDRTFARSPTPEESQRLQDFVTNQAAGLRQENRPTSQLALPPTFQSGSDPFTAAAMVQACLALLNKPAVKANLKRNPQQQA